MSKKVLPGALEIKGPLTLPGDPTANLHAATKQYVDAHSGGGGPIRRALYLSIPGEVVLGTTASMRVPFPTSSTIVAVKSTCRTAAVFPYTFDINKNGNTIYTTQANRPTRTSAHGTSLVTHAVPDVTSVAQDDVFTIDVDQDGVGLEDILFVIYCDG